MSITKEKVIDALRYVDDPDLKKDLITLNMVKDVTVDGKKVSFTVVLTTPACPMKDAIRNACHNAILHFVDKDAEVNINMTADVTQGKKQNGEALKGVKNIIAVSSGKGGVGKSTVAANLALGLARQGAKVGIMDADIHGPSIPIMFNVEFDKPMVVDVNGKTMMVPVESYGIKIMSIGFFADPSQAIVWRGPMVTKAINQFFFDTQWGDLDYLIVDLPPGTGDIHLSLISAVPLSGAIIISTPQRVALADARKGIDMFKNPQLNVPILGLVENMAWFTPAELPENKYFIFGKNGALDLATEMGIPLLGQIPLIQSICEAGDAGRPAVLQENSPQALSFIELAQNTAQQIAIKNAEKMQMAE